MPAPARDGRALALAALLSALVLLAGCSTLIPTADGPSVTTDGTTLEPGETGTVVVEATSVTAVRFGLPENGVTAGNVTLDFENATIEPAPDRVAESYPPIWSWTDQQSVRVEIPVHVAPDAAQRTYVYTVHVRNESGASVTAEVPVQVRD